MAVRKRRSRSVYKRGQKGHVVDLLEMGERAYRYLKEQFFRIFRIGLLRRGWAACPAVKKMKGRLPVEDPAVNVVCRRGSTGKSYMTFIKICARAAMKLRCASGGACNP
jgi:hypothetical protein